MIICLDLFFVSLEFEQETFWLKEGPSLCWLCDLPSLSSKIILFILLFLFFFFSPTTHTLPQSRLARSIINNQMNHSDVAAGVTPFRHHMSDDNVTGGHAKVTQVGSVTEWASGVSPY